MIALFVTISVLLCGPVQAGLLDSLVGTWKGSSTWRYGKQKQVATGTITIKKLGGTVRLVGGAKLQAL